MLSCKSCINTGVVHATVHGGMHQTYNMHSQMMQYALVVCSVGDVHRL